MYRDAFAPTQLGQQQDAFACLSPSEGALEASIPKLSAMYHPAANSSLDSVQELSQYSTENEVSLFNNRITRGFGKGYLSPTQNPVLSRQVCPAMSSAPAGLPDSMFQTKMTCRMRMNSPDYHKHTHDSLSRCSSIGKRCRCLLHPHLHKHGLAASSMLFVNNQWAPSFQSMTKLSGCRRYASPTICSMNKSKVGVLLRRLTRSVRVLTVKLLAFVEAFHGRGGDDK